MEKGSFLIFLLLLLNTIVKGQSLETIKDYQNKMYMPLSEFKGDTLEYLKINFIDNKGKYLGKDLNHLLRDCEIPVKSYLVEYDENNYNYIYSIDLSFYSHKSTMSKIGYHLKTQRIIVVWKPALPSDSVQFLIHHGFGLIKSELDFDWTKNTLKYFGNKKINDLILIK